MGVRETVERLIADTAPYRCIRLSPWVSPRTANRLAVIARHYATTPDDLAAALLNLLLDRSEDQQIIVLDTQTGDCLFYIYPGSRGTETGDGSRPPRGDRPMTPWAFVRDTRTNRVYADELWAVSESGLVGQIYLGTEADKSACVLLIKGSFDGAGQQVLEEFASIEAAMRYFWVHHLRVGRRLCTEAHQHGVGEDDGPIHLPKAWVTPPYAWHTLHGIAQDRGHTTRVHYGDDGVLFTGCTRCSHHLWIVQGQVRNRTLLDRTCEAVMAHLGHPDAQPSPFPGV